jgi:hypothetical protein
VGWVEKSGWCDREVNMGLGADAEPRRSANPDNLVMPSRDQIKNFQVVCSSGPWEITALARISSIS